MTGIDQYHPYNALHPYDSDGAHWIWDDARLQPGNSTRIANSGSNYPQAQDIIIFSSAVGGGYGHAAIVDSATSRSNVTVVESNWTYPLSGDRRTMTIDGTILGWFRKNGGGGPPSVPFGSITTPSQDGMTVDTAEYLAGSASDQGSTVSSVQVFLSNALIGSATYDSGSSTWSYLFDPSPYDAGQYTLTLVVTDAQGNSAPCNRYITIAHGTVISQITGHFTGTSRSQIAAFYKTGDIGVNLWVFAQNPNLSTAMVPTQQTSINLSQWTGDAMKVVTGDFNGDGYTDVGVFYKYSFYGQPGVYLYIFWGSASGLQSPVNSGIDLSGWTWEAIKVVSGHFGYSSGTASDIAVFYRTGTSSCNFWVLPGGPSGPGSPINGGSYIGNWTWEAINPVAGDFNGDGYTDIAAVYRYNFPGTKIWMFNGGLGGLSAPVNVWTDPSNNQFTWEAVKPVAGKFHTGSSYTDLVFVYNIGTPSQPSTRFWGFSGSSSGIQAPVQWGDLGGWSWTATKPMAGDFYAYGCDVLDLFYKSALPLQPGSKIWMVPPSSSGLTATPSAVGTVWNDTWIWEFFKG